MKKCLALLVLIFTLALSLVSCDLFHKHTWQSYLVSSPSCTQKGILKELCTECGEMVLSEINTLDHNYVNGVCTECGQYKDESTELYPVAIPIGSNNDGLWSLEKIYELLRYAGQFQYSSYYDFTSSLPDTYFTRMSISSNALHITMTCSDDGEEFDTPLIYSITRVSPENKNKSIGTIIRADVVDGELYLTYNNGNEVFAGCLSGKNIVTIVGFGINYENELIIYYSNDTLAFGGKLSK